MQDVRFLTPFYLFFAVLFGLCGLALAFFPGSLFSLWHPQQDSNAMVPVLARQAGAGLLLAAAITAVCLRASPLRAVLHSLVLLFLIGFAASHGATLLAGPACWMLLPVAVFALPLLITGAGALKRQLSGPGRLPAVKATRHSDKAPKNKAPKAVQGSLQGEIKWFNPNKGFGFIQSDDGREIFVHFRALQNGGRRTLRQGARVSFEVHDTDRGEQARDVYVED
ncbi:cold-shock protein [Alcanivorax limicola]|uniref:cold-shock protein n=1 Tax=Alcanivorax limicola TaxID=2874102 RepID=UPI002958580B|nr:cold shock domain-containing protein [Alcanivorax limicola]